MEGKAEKGTSDVMPHKAVLVSVKIQNTGYPIFMEEDIIEGKVLVGDAFGKPFKEGVRKLAQDGLLGQ